MTIVEYYEDFKVRVNDNIDTTLKTENAFYSQLTKNRSFVEDYTKWLEILDKRPEIEIYKNALKVYQEAFGNMLMGLYQPAFMGLRYFLERTLSGVYFSGSEIELRTWMIGQRDTYWSEVIGSAKSDGEEKTSKSKTSEDKNMNKGLFSTKFTRAFFPEIEKAAVSFLGQTSMVYRECSEFVHGNPEAIRKVGLSIDYSEELVTKWNDCADTVARCILYAFMMRYWCFIESVDKSKVIDRIRDEFSTTDIINDLID